MASENEAFVMVSCANIAIELVDTKSAGDGYTHLAPEGRSFDDDGDMYINNACL